MGCRNHFFTLILVATFAIVANGDTDTMYTFDNGNYIGQTHYNASASTIEFVVTVKTLGWVGIGVGPNPSMANADIVIGGVLDNNTAYYTDMFGTGNGSPSPDNKAESDWVLVSSYQNITTQLTYRRLLRTNDANAGQDYEIKNEDLYVLWAYGLNDTIGYHNFKRGYGRGNLIGENTNTTTTVLPTTNGSTGSPLPTTNGSTGSPLPTTNGSTGSPLPTTTPSSGGGDKEHSFDNGAYYLRTKSDKNAGTIEFHVRVKTLGWVGIGVGPNPSMANADIVIGGVTDSNNTEYYTDMHATANGTPTPDTKAVSDWILVNSSQNSTSNETTIVYRRSLKTNDTNVGQDFEIKNEDLYVLWAYGLNDTISYHANSKRGFARVNLIGEVISTTPSSAGIPYSFVMLFTVFLPVITVNIF